ncbi:hypothetical protein EP7_001726 [Isosphaeraceae bacterium EP7]
MDEARPTDARRRLLNAANPRGGWGERAGVPSRAEPTALACLALAGETSAEAPLALAARWLAARQGPDGAVTAAEALPGVAWATPHALLAWRSLGVDREAQKRAARCLLARSGAVSEADAVVGHDQSLIGWSWVEGTHSWVEPTAWAILALASTGDRGHPRVEQGLALILDRSIPTGGWNYGNRTVFGRALRPHPGPTGLALLALAHLGGPTPPAVTKAICYLKDVLPATRAGGSLAWGVMGLKAWGAAPPESPRWLATALDDSDHPDQVSRKAALLLASAQDPLARFGLKAGNAPR